MTSNDGDDASQTPATPTPDEPEVVEADHRDPALEAELASIRAVGENRTGGQ